MQLKFKFHALTLLLCLCLFTGYAQKDQIKVIAYYAGNPATLDSFDVKKMDEIIFSFGRLQGNEFSYQKCPRFYNHTKNGST